MSNEITTGITPDNEITTGGNINLDPADEIGLCEGCS